MFIDDIPHKTWIYLLKTKGEVFDKFQEFKAKVENLKRRKIKIPRSDNGGEYTSKEIVSFCKQARNQRELIFSYNPHKNGV